MTAVTNAHVYGTCLEIVGVMNIKIWLQDTYVQDRIENTEREKCDDLPFLELHVQTLLPWAESTKEFTL